VHNAFLEEPLSGTLIIKRLQSKIIQKSLGAFKSMDLNRVGKKPEGEELDFINNYII
jgi:hypothetical protein